MATSTKYKIIEATKEVILKNGIDQFTLESVAEEANISKGGLLYHFASKDDLIEAMNAYAAKDFRKLVMTYVQAGESFHAAYVLATTYTLENKSILQITTSLLAALSINRDLLYIWQEEYQFIQQALANEAMERTTTLLIKAVCDGLWFSALFPFQFMSEKEQKEILSYLLLRLQGDD